MTRLVSLVVVVLSASALADKPPAPKEWEPVIDGLVDALRKGDAKAIVKVYGSFAELAAVCPGLLERVNVADEDKRRNERAEKAVKDCAGVDWKVAKRVATEGGGPKSSSVTQKCPKVEISRDIFVTIEAAGKTWRIKLDGLYSISGKRAMMEAPSCREKTES